MGYVYFYSLNKATGRLEEIETRINGGYMLEAERADRGLAKRLAVKDPETKAIIDVTSGDFGGRIVNVKFWTPERKHRFWLVPEGLTGEQKTRLREKYGFGIY